MFTSEQVMEFKDKLSLNEDTINIQEYLLPLNKDSETFRELR